MNRISVVTLGVCLLTGAAFAQNSGRVRVVHASPNAPTVDVLVDGSKVLENLPFREYSEYLPLSAGSHEIPVNVTGTNTTVLQAAPTITAGRDYTAIAVGLVGRQPALDILLLEDNNTLPVGNTIKVRVVHGAPSAPAVDVYVTTPFESLDGKTAALTNVPFKAASGYLQVPPALYQARVTLAGTKTVAIDSHRLVTWAGIIRTVIAVDAPNGGAPFDFIVLPDLN
jgi:hypothetical protein